MRKIDPIERALDAYFELTESERRIFAAAVKHVDRYAGTTTEAPTPRRGRPAGSKNRKAASVNSLAPETFEPAALFAQNGAVTEDL